MKGGLGFGRCRLHMAVDTQVWGHARRQWTWRMGPWSVAGGSQVGEHCLCPSAAAHLLWRLWKSNLNLTVDLAPTSLEELAVVERPGQLGTQALGCSQKDGRQGLRC